MARCSCPPTGLLDTSCPVHGLVGDGYPPMRNYARRILGQRTETDAETQLRLYRESFDPFRRPLRSCPTRFGQR